MFSLFVGFVASHMLYLLLHLESSSFPKPLSAKREGEAFAALKAGDASARDLLIRHNLRLVAHVAKKYYASGQEQDDLISIGVIGLIKAVDSFDPAKGARFATYGARCVENELLMNFRAGKKNQGTAYISDPLEGDSEGGLTLNDVVADPFCMDEDYELSEERDELRRMVQSTLEGRERQVILLRYGFGGQEPLTQQQVAGMLGISRSYVSRIEKKAVERLKASFANIKTL